MANTYDKGDLVRNTGTWTDAAGAAVDPTTVVFKYTDPGGVTMTLTYSTDPEVVRSSTGIYYVDVSIDEVGRWITRWESTGTGQAAGEGEFYIRRSEF